MISEGSDGKGLGAARHTAINTLQQGEHFHVPSHLEVVEVVLQGGDEGGGGAAWRSVAGGADGMGTWAALATQGRRGSPGPLITSPPATPHPCCPSHMLLPSVSTYLPPHLSLPPSLPPSPQLAIPRLTPPDQPHPTTTLFPSQPAPTRQVLRIPRGVHGLELCGHAGVVVHGLRNAVRGHLGPRGAGRCGGARAHGRGRGMGMQGAPGVPVCQCAMRTCAHGMLWRHAPWPRPGTRGTPPPRPAGPCTTCPAGTVDRGAGGGIARGGVCGAQVGYMG